MIEKIKKTKDFGSQNRELLKKSELGVVLADAYRTALNIEPRLSQVEIVPFNDDSKRIAFARPSWHPESGGHNQIHIRLEDLDGALERTQNLLDNLPGARELFGKIMEVEAKDITPQLIHVFSILHEFGHTQEYLDNEADPSKLAKRNKRDKEALPIGRATVSQLMDTSSFARKFVEDNWHRVIEATGVSTIEELIKKQHGAYRQTAGEQYADNFAVGALWSNPTLVDQLTSDNFDYYRHFKAA